MLVNSELYMALEEAGVSDEKAAAAAAILADVERRLARIDVYFWALKVGAVSIGAGLLAAFAMFVVLV